MKAQTHPPGRHAWHWEQAEELKRMAECPPREPSPAHPNRVSGAYADGWTFCRSGTQGTTAFAPTGAVVLITGEHGTERANPCIPINSAFAIASTTSQPMLLS